MQPRGAFSGISIKTNTSNYTTQYSVYDHSCLPEVVVKKTVQDVTSEHMMADLLPTASLHDWAISQDMGRRSTL